MYSSFPSYHYGDENVIATLLMDAKRCLFLIVDG
jgi:hypothetical protein